ncbi:unnamed protein product [Leptosia nina]|uniref:Ribosomal protein S4 n=1 Tax=Leptosia nina TaxID=320188 RepID=A0AAV1J9F9_9NEOP
MDKILVNVYTARSRLHYPVQKPIAVMIKQTNSTTRTPLPMATRHKTVEKNGRITKEHFLQKMEQTKINSIVMSGNNPSPNFEIDELDVQTRRFDVMRNKTLETDNTLREHYFDKEYGPVAYKHKWKTVRLMEQFIYETRYKLPFVQLLRKKYILQPRYRIGFCFALLNYLRQQQILLYAALKRNMNAWINLSAHLKVYEKIIRLDVDIRDLIAYIKKINWDRMQKEEPYYFDSVKDLQQ